MMEVWLTISVVVLATAVAALAYAVIQDRKVPRTLVIQRPLPPQHTASGREPEPTNVPPLASIALESGLGRVMEISIATDRQSRKLAESTPVNSALFRNALATLPSVLPSLVLSQQIAGTHLMEVVIRGHLVSAADGFGYRAIAMGSDGIATNARLLDPSSLQRLASGALAFQVLSAIVGQKHLQDIDRRLMAIDQKLDAILGLLRGERRARIEAAFRYMKDVVHAIEDGESAAAARQQLETLEFQLSIDFKVVQSDIRQVLGQPLERSVAGSQREYESLSKKLVQHRALFEEMGACIKVRQVCCYVSSLYPGQRKLMSHRLDGLRVDIRAFADTWRNAKRAMESEIPTITSKWTPATAKEGRDVISSEVVAFSESIDREVEAHGDLNRSICKAMSDMDRQTTLYVRVEDGKVINTRMAVEGAE